MIDWMAVKTAAQGPSGWMPTDTGVAPKPVLTSEQQQRKDAFWKGFGSHFTDPQSYKDLARTYGALLTRGALKAPMLPYAALSYPVSWVGKGANRFAYNFNKVSPAQYQHSKEVFDGLNKPVEWWNNKVTGKGIDYPESVKENPISSAVTNIGEDIVGGKALSVGAKAYRAADNNAPRLMNRIKMLPRRINKWIHAGERGNNLSQKLFEHEKTLPKVRLSDIKKEIGTPSSVPVRWSENPQSGDINASFKRGLPSNKASRIELALLGSQKPKSKMAFTFRRPLVQNYMMDHAPMEGRKIFRNKDFITPSSMLKHELGHASAWANNLNSRLTGPTPFDAINPNFNPTVYDELIADRLAFGPTWFSTVRHHPAIAGYISKARKASLYNWLLLGGSATPPAAAGKYVYDKAAEN